MRKLLEVRVLTFDDVTDNKDLLDLKVVFKGTLKKIQEWGLGKNFSLKRDSSLFGFYFSDGKYGDCYFIT